MRNCLDRLHPLPKSGDRLPVRAKLPVREVVDPQVRDPAEGWPGELGTHLFFAIVRRDQEQAFQRTGFVSQGQIQHPHDARVDRSRVLNLICGYDP